VDNPLIGKQVKTEDGHEGTLLAVAHVGGGTGIGGWQLLILRENRMITADIALNAHVLEPEPHVEVIDR
jgi:hypothetical protein